MSAGWIDAVAEEVTFHANWAKPERFADAFRLALSQRVCAHCRHYMPIHVPEMPWVCLAGNGLTFDNEYPNPQTFGCTRFEPTPTPVTP